MYNKLLVSVCVFILLWWSAHSFICTVSIPSTAPQRHTPRGRQRRVIISDKDRHHKTQSDIAIGLCVCVCVKRRFIWFINTAQSDDVNLANYEMFWVLQLRLITKKKKTAKWDLIKFHLLAIAYLIFRLLTRKKYVSMLSI